METYKAGDLVTILSLLDLKDEIKKASNGSTDAYIFLCNSYCEYAGKTTRIDQVGYDCKLGDCYFYLQISGGYIRWFRRYFRHFTQKQTFYKECSQ